MGMAAHIMPVINSSSCKHRKWEFGYALITELSEATMLVEKQLKPHRVDREERGGGQPKCLIESSRTLTKSLEKPQRFFSP